MKIDILTLFPKMFDGFLSESIIARGLKAGYFSIATHYLRDWAADKHGTVDEPPYGGGPGMVLKVDVIDRALLDLREKRKEKREKPGVKSMPYVILMTPQGAPFTQGKAQELSQKEHLILIAGHYEGFDERVRALVDEEISIGDYVLTGGELPAMVVTDAVVRLLPGVLGDEASPHEESFSSTLTPEPYTLLEYPHYTRPESYTPLSRPELGELTVPEILTSGHHAKIEEWRKAQALEKTKLRRPDLL